MHQSQEKAEEMRVRVDQDLAGRQLTIRGTDQRFMQDRSSFLLSRVLRVCQPAEERVEMPATQSCSEHLLPSHSSFDSRNSGGKDVNKWVDLVQFLFCTSSQIVNVTSLRNGAHRSG